LYKIARQGQLNSIARHEPWIQGDAEGDAFSRIRPAPIRGLSKKDPAGNPISTAHGSMQQSSLAAAGCSRKGPKFGPDTVELALRGTRWHCGCASTSSCRIARAHGFFCTSADREGGRCLYRDRRRHSWRSLATHSRREKGKDPLVVKSFLHAIGTTRRRGFAANPLQIIGLPDFDETDDCSFEEDDEICANRSR
jgi:hypothetical protein